MPAMQQRVWYVLAWGYPEPRYFYGPEFASEHAAVAAQMERQNAEPPTSEGGATWAALRVERIA